MLNSDWAELDSLLERAEVPTPQPHKRANKKAERHAYYSDYLDKKRIA
jgi:Zn-finger nucleic acid-binding protein